MGVKTHSLKRIFKILVIENESSFYEMLLSILSSCTNIFPFLKFDVGRASTRDDFGEPDMKGYDLVFIEDNALLELKKQKEEIDFILLLNGYFFKTHARQIKKMITKKSLNLYEHISLTNYSYDLIRVLVIDFIKSKIKWPNVRKTPNSNLLFY